jgi:hypothetical protein
VSNFKYESKSGDEAVEDGRAGVEREIYGKENNILTDVI